MAKISKIISFDKIEPEVLAAVQKKYPEGWRNYIKKFDKGNGTFFHAISVDFGDYSYLIKVNVKIDSLSELEKEEKKLEYNEIPKDEIEVEFDDEENYEDR